MSSPERGGQITLFLRPSVSTVSCHELRSRGAEFSNYLGFGSGGVTKHSIAAQAMSREAKMHGGGVPKMRDGGVTASLQRIGATGYIKQEAAATISNAMRSVGLKNRNDCQIRML